MRKWFIVQNPVSGVRDAASVRSAIEKAFTAAGETFEIYQTTGEEDLSAVVKDALGRGFDHFAAAGGDGTIASMACGLVGTTYPVGIIPLGTGNGLARDMQIPFAIKGALNLILNQHRVMAIDLIKVNDEFHCLNLTVGVTARMIKKTSRGGKRKLGMSAYFITGFRTLARVKPYRLYLEVDGKRQHVHTTEVMLLNSSIFREPVIGWSEDVLIDDGELDLFIFPAAEALTFLQLVWHFLRGRPKRDPQFQWVAVKESVFIRSRQPVSVQADGDFLGETPVFAELVPRALHVIVP